MNILTIILLAQYILYKIKIVYIIVQILRPISRLLVQATRQYFGYYKKEIVVIHKLQINTPKW